MSEHPKIAIFPGTFDPLTNGHLDVIIRGCTMFEKFIVAIGHNPDKQELFTMKQRIEMIRALMDEHGLDVQIESYEGLTVDYAKRVNATVIMRGIRNVTDLNFEFQLALTNRAVADIETVFIMTSQSHAFTSSSLIKQIASAGRVERLHKLLPGIVLEKLKETLADDDSILTHKDAFTDS